MHKGKHECGHFAQKVVYAREQGRRGPSLLHVCLNNHTHAHIAILPTDLHKSTPLARTIVCTIPCACGAHKAACVLLRLRGFDTLTPTPTPAVATAPCCGCSCSCQEGVGAWGGSYAGYMLGVYALGVRALS